MGICPDLIGKRFGKLVVQSQAETVNKNSMWNCLCDCGNTYVASGRSLRSGQRRDCGCETILYHDLTGKRFGSLVVVSRAPSSNNRKTRWLCQCDCGNTYVATSEALRAGRKNDCGCKTNYGVNSHLIDLTGQRFGKLTVISKEPARADEKTRWLCKCDCGNTRVITSGDLRTGRRKSCGCAKIKDIAGKRFGRLTAIRRTDRFVVHGERKIYLWECKCDCGELVYMTPGKLHENVDSACKKCRAETRIAEMDALAGYVEGTQLSRLAATKPTAASKSGVRGVWWNSKTQRWRAILGFQGKTHYLGEYKELEDAEKARKEAEEIYFAPILERYPEFIQQK